MVLNGPQEFASKFFEFSAFPVPIVNVNWNSSLLACFANHPKQVPHLFWHVLPIIQNKHQIPQLPFPLWPNISAHTWSLNWQNRPSCLLSYKKPYMFKWPQKQWSTTYFSTSSQLHVVVLLILPQLEIKLYGTRYNVHIVWSLCSVKNQHCSHFLKPLHNSLGASCSGVTLFPSLVFFTISLNQTVIAHCIFCSTLHWSENV